MIKDNDLKVGDLVRHVMDIKKGFKYPGIVIELKSKEALVMWPTAMPGWHKIHLLTADESE